MVCRAEWPWTGPAWAGNAGFSAAACKTGRLQLGNLFLLPVPNRFGSKVAVFFHIKMFGFILQGSNKFHTVHNVLLIFQRLFIAALTFNLDGEAFISTFFCLPRPAFQGKRKAFYYFFKLFFSSLFLFWKKPLK